MRKATITAVHFRHKEALHGYLQAALGFPDYYGRNLSALADCLAEACEPIELTIAVEACDLPADMQAYALRFAQVCAREALANENVTLTVIHE